MRPGATEGGHSSFPDGRPCRQRSDCCSHGQLHTNSGILPPCPHEMEMVRARDEEEEEERMEAAREQIKQEQLSKGGKTTQKKMDRKHLHHHLTLEEVERGFLEYLERTPEERNQFRDPIAFSDRELHLNQCLKVVPNSLREPIKFFKPFPDNEAPPPILSDNFTTNYRLFLAIHRPRYPIFKKI